MTDMEYVGWKGEKKIQETILEEYRQGVENFAEKYIKTLKVQVGSDGTMELVIRR